MQLIILEPQILEMFMTVDKTQPWRFLVRPQKVLKKLVSNCAFISSIEVSPKAPIKSYPALFTTISILFFSFAILLMASVTDLSLLTSSWITSNGRFSFFWLYLLFALPLLPLYYALLHKHEIHFLPMQEKFQAPYHF
jgi:hypothetical protein